MQRVLSEHWHGRGVASLRVIPLQMLLAALLGLLDREQRDVIAFHSKENPAHSAPAPGER